MTIQKKFTVTVGFSHDAREKKLDKKAQELENKGWTMVIIPFLMDVRSRRLRY